MYEWTEWAARAVGTTPMFQRLLFRNVGEVYLLTHDSAAVDGVRYIRPDDLERELARQPPATAAAAPFPGPQLVSQLQQMLEHSHRSYTHDLLIAARLRQRREEAGAAAACGEDAPEHGNGTGSREGCSNGSGGSPQQGRNGAGRIEAEHSTVVSGRRSQADVTVG